jgi:sugar phosphate isomerase/epimerase
MPFHPHAQRSATVTIMPVGYSSNLHAAEGVAELQAVLAGFTTQVRARLGWQRMGLDLRLGSQAIAELADPTVCTRLRRSLDDAGVDAYSLNAFPLRPFQAAVVKADAYLPDWTDSQRERDTIALIPIALALSDAQLITISTVPGSYRPFGHIRNDAQRIAAALGRWAGHAALARRQHGRTVVLCLEPEPWCLLETSWDAAWFWQGPLALDGLTACAGILDGDHDAARSALAVHLGICFDTCHFSLAYEDQAAAVTRLRNAGIPIAKCQFSAAPQVRDPQNDPAGVQTLQGLAEPRFMHQTCAVSANGSTSKVQDLDQLGLCLARLPGAIAVRSHFHIPVYRPVQGSGLSSTVADSVLGLRACVEAGCRHLSVETYTWSILAESERDALQGTVRELEFLTETINGLPERMRKV